MRSRYESGVSYLSSLDNAEHAHVKGRDATPQAEQRADVRAREMRIYHKRRIGGQRRGHVCPVFRSSSC